MAEIAQPEAAGSNRRVKLVILIVAVIVAYMIGRSINKGRVIAGLASKDPEVRKQSTLTLMEWKIFTDTLSRQTVPVKRPMIVTLRDMNNEQAVGELVALMKDRNPTVQNEAQFALHAMRPTSIPKLVDALKAPDLNVKNRAAATLIAIGPAVLQPTTNKDGKEVVALIEAISAPPARAGVTRIITALPKGASPWLLAKLNDEKADAGTKACAIDILGRINAREASAPIRAMLNAEKVDAPVRNASLIALGRLHHPEAFTLLQTALADKDPSLQMTAIVGFGALQDPRAVDSLKAYLFGYDEALRDAAVAALTNIGAPAIPALASLLTNPRYEVRVGALRALEGIKDARVPGLLASALKDQDENVRRSAAEALGRPNDANAVAPLLSALADPAWRVAAQARESLAVVGRPAVAGLVGVLSQSAQSSAAFYAQGALEKIGEPAVGALMAAAQSGAVSTRQRAVLALGTIGDKRAVALLEGIASKSGDPAVAPVADAASRALARIREGRRVG